MNKEQLLKLESASQEFVEHVISLIKLENFKLIFEAVKLSAEEYDRNPIRYFFAGRTEEAQTLLQDFEFQSGLVQVDGKRFFTVLHKNFSRGGFESTSLNVIILRQILLLVSAEKYSQEDTQRLDQHLANSMIREKLLATLKALSEMVVPSVVIASSNDHSSSSTASSPVNNSLLLANPAQLLGMGSLSPLFPQGMSRGLQEIYSFRQLDLQDGVVQDIKPGPQTASSPVTGLFYQWFSNAGHALNTLMTEENEDEMPRPGYENLHFDEFSLN